MGFLKFKLIFFVFFICLQNIFCKPHTPAENLDVEVICKKIVTIAQIEDETFHERVQNALGEENETRTLMLNNLDFSSWWLSLNDAQKDIIGKCISSIEMPNIFSHKWFTDKNLSKNFRKNLSKNLLEDINNGSLPFLSETSLKVFIEIVLKAFQEFISYEFQKKYFKEKDPDYFTELRIQALNLSITILENSNESYLQRLENMITKMNTLMLSQTVKVMTESDSKKLEKLIDKIADHPLSKKFRNKVNQSIENITDKNKKEIFMDFLSFLKIFFLDLNDFKFENVDPPFLMNEIYKNLQSYVVQAEEKMESRKQQDLLNEYIRSQPKATYPVTEKKPPPPLNPRKRYNQRKL